MTRPKSKQQTWILIGHYIFILSIILKHGNIYNLLLDHVNVDLNNKACRLLLYFLRGNWALIMALFKLNSDACFGQHVDLCIHVCMYVCVCLFVYLLRHLSEKTK